jgi:hypothetical protein
LLVRKVCKVAKVQLDLQVPKVYKAFKVHRGLRGLLDRKVCKVAKVQQVVPVHKVL